MGVRKTLTLNPLALLAIVAASFLSAAMFTVRVAYSGHLVHRFLIWNLFLAWLPLLFALLAWLLRRWSLPSWMFGILWLLFLPNAPYLVTDLVHLREIGSVPLWYDAIMLFSFALTGLLLGVHSLHLMQVLVSHRFGALSGWLLVLTASVLSGLGIYIGRFLRWNSWDLFFHPTHLLVDITNSLTTPHLQLKLIVVVFLFSAMTGVAYLFFYLFNTQPKITISLPAPITSSTMRPRRNR